MQIEIKVPLSHLYWAFILSKPLLSPYYLFTAFSITCYQCVPEMTAGCDSFNTKQCIRHQTKRICPKGMDSCMWTRVHGIFNNRTIDVEQRSCATGHTCGSLQTSCDWNNNNTDLKCGWSCCKSDLCNVGNDASYSPVTGCFLRLLVALLTLFL